MKLAQFKHFEPIQSQEVLNLVPGSSATTTISSIDKDRNQNVQSVDFRQVIKPPGSHLIFDSKLVAET